MDVDQREEGQEGQVGGAEEGVREVGEEGGAEEGHGQVEEGRHVQGQQEGEEGSLGREEDYRVSRDVHGFERWHTQL